jgi:hypothetical protein
VIRQMARDRACQRAAVVWQAGPDTFRVTFVARAAGERDCGRLPAVRKAAVQPGRPQMVVYPARAQESSRRVAAGLGGLRAAALPRGT